MAKKIKEQTANEIINLIRFSTREGNIPDKSWRDGWNEGGEFLVAEIRGLYLDNDED